MREEAFSSIFVFSFFNPNIKCGREEMCYMREKVMLVITWWGSWWWFFPWKSFSEIYIYTCNTPTWRDIYQKPIYVSHHNNKILPTASWGGILNTLLCCHYLVYIHLIHLFKHYSLPIILPLIKEPSFCCVLNIIYDDYACSFKRMHIIS